MYEETLKQAGLTIEQSRIYTTLLQNGPLPARRIVLNTGIKRGLTYKALDQLEEIGLVQKKDQEGKVTKFNPIHPSKIMEIIDNRRKNLETVTESLKSVVGQMTSDYNLFSGKPNVQFFEGERGLKEVLDDSLYAKSEILSYADLESIQKYIPKINEKHVADRRKFEISKRGLLLDTPFNRKTISSYDKDVTNIKFIEVKDSNPYQSLMNIYDNKVSYLTLDENKMIGVIIEDEHIAQMHRYIFEYGWDKAND
jgi:sugar-specific transcriptional regulator TrmB